MGTVNITDITDGTTADADDVNSRLTAITDEVNGNLDSNNIATSGVGTNQIADDAVTYPKRSFVGCHVNLNGSNQTVSTATATKIVFDTEVYDIGSNFDTSTNIFTAPENGYYLVCASVLLNNITADKQVQVRVVVDGTDTIQGNGYGSVTNSDPGANVSGVLYLTSGQEVEIRAYHDSGVDEDVNGSTWWTYATITQVGA